MSSSLSKIIPVPTRIWHGNLLYPLPANYFEVASRDEEAARQLRVNACRQWLITRKQAAAILCETVPEWVSLSKEDRIALVETYKAEAFVACVRFFDEYYLRPDPITDFNPLFYDMDPLPTPDFHFSFYRDFSIYPMSIDVAPRGSAKSSCVRKPIILTMVSGTNYHILYCTSSDKVATETSQICRYQCYNNPRIVADWTPEMPSGSIRPVRGEAPTGIEEFHLGNGSWLATYSVNSKMRGKRPHWFILDDPEYDPHASTSMAERRSYMHRLIFKIAMPMVMRAESKLSWLATFVSKRHYAWLAMQTEPVIMENGQVIERAKIEEFDYWNRRLVKACWNDATTGELISCWPHMWPVSAAQRDALGLDPSTVTLPEIEKRIGKTNFNSEYMGIPGTGDDGFFKINEKDHGWYPLKSTIDDDYAKAPWKSQTVIKWFEGDAEQSAKLSDFLASARLFITMDTSRTARPDSDYKVCTLMATTKKSDLFVLDMWAAKASQEKLMQKAFDIANRWGCRLICPEELEDGIQLVRTMKNIVQRQISQGSEMSKLPIIRGFNPGYTRKTTKIAALAMRFEHGKIKLPFHLRMRQPFAELFNQIEGFNPDVDENGGLQNDDHLDTVSMSEYVTGMKLRRDPDELKEETDVFRLIEAGERFDKAGVPLVQYLDLDKMDVEKMRLLIKASWQPPKGGSVL